MKVRNVVFLTILSVGSMSANIISTTLGPSVSGNIYTNPLWVQSFASPSQSVQTQITPQYTSTVVDLTPTGTPLNALTGQDVITSYADIDLSYSATNNGETQAAGLIYDPNGTGFAGCSSGNLTTGPAQLTFPTNCVGNWTLPSGGKQATSINPLSNPTTSFSILFDVPTTQAAFDIAVGSPAMNQGPNTLLTVYFSDGSYCGLNSSGVCVANTASTGYHFSTSNTNNNTLIEFTSAANTPIEAIVLASSGGNENAGYTWNVNVSNVEANAPEPGTLGLIGLGLAGVGYFARRRKSA